MDRGALDIQMSWYLVKGWRALFGAQIIFKIIIDPTFFVDVSMYFLIPDKGSFFDISHKLSLVVVADVNNIKIIFP